MGRRETRLAIIFQAVDEASDIIEGIGSGVEGLWKKVKYGAEAAKLFVDFAKGIAEAGKLVFESTKEQAEGINLISMAAQRIGASTEFVSRFAHVAKQAGIDTEAFADQLRDMSERAVNNRADFERFGLSVLDTNKNVKSAEQLFYDISDAMARATSQSERLAIAEDLIGSDAGKLVPILQAGSRALKEFGEQADTVGATISNADAVIAQDFIGSLSDLKAVADSVFRTVAESVMPALSDVMVTLKLRLVALAGWVRNNEVAMQGFVRNGIVQAVRGFGQLIRAANYLVRAVRGVHLGFLLLRKAWQSIDVAMMDTVDSLTTLMQKFLDIYVAVGLLESNPLTDWIKQARDTYQELGDEASKDIEDLTDKTIEWEAGVKAIVKATDDLATSLSNQQGFQATVNNLIEDNTDKTKSNIAAKEKQAEADKAAKAAAKTVADAIKEQERIIQDASAKQLQYWEDVYQGQVDAQRRATQLITADEQARILKLAEINKDAPRPLTQDQQGVQDLAGQIAKLKKIQDEAKQAEEMTRQAWEGVGSSIGQGLRDFATGAKSAGEAFRQFARDVATEALRLLAKKAVMKVIDWATGSFAAETAETGGRFLGSFFGSLFRNKGGPIGYQSGGLVGGRTGPDSVLARLTPGEFVLPKYVVDAIRRGNTPVPSASPTGATTVSPATTYAPNVSLHFHSVTPPDRISLQRFMRDDLGPIMRDMTMRGML